MTQPNTTRRAILSAATTALAYAGGAAIAGAGLVVAGEAKSQTISPSTSAWRQAIAACDRARAADDEINAIFAKMDEARTAELKALPPLSDACHKHFCTSLDWQITARDIDAHERDWFASKGRTWNAPAGEDAKFRAIFNEVRERQAQRAAINAKHNYDALEHEWDRRGEVLNKAEWAVFHTPAPDLAALAWKIEMLKRHGYLFEERQVSVILADMQRLGGEA